MNPHPCLYFTVQKTQKLVRFIYLNIGLYRLALPSRILENPSKRPRGRLKYLSTVMVI